MLIADIVIGEPTRKEAAHLETLAQSLRDIGLINPVTVNSRNELIAGRRRLEAAKRCGWETIPVRVVAAFDDAVAALKAERDENVCREPLTPTEYLTLGKRLEAMLRPAAAERQHDAGKAAGRGRPLAPGKLPKANSRVRTQVVEAVGPEMGERTYAKGRAVMDAAEAEPELFGDLPDLMNKTSVSAASEELKRRSGASKKPKRNVTDELFRRLFGLASELITASKDITAAKTFNAAAKRLDRVAQLEMAGELDRACQCLTRHATDLRNMDLR